MTRVLVVDDEPAVRFTLAEALADRGHETIAAASGAEALARLDGVDALVTDLSMPGMDGLELLRRVREEDAELPVIVVTARGSERAAVAAMKAGAYDYLAKPFDVEELGLAVARALEARRLRGETRRLHAEQELGVPIVGEAPAFRRVLEQARRVAGRDVTVLLRGETGTGKELVASLLHLQSRRARGPLVRCNCAAIPAELAEAELFGHERGAFTGAVAARRGVFAQAHGGTLVLDEVGELPPALQPKLLRALQSGEVQPLGASGPPARVDVRVVASTHRDLRAEVAAGRFREDLYFRLAVVELVLPPLRERREDIPALVAAFARRYRERFGVVDVTLAPALVAALGARDWPGNVRELENAVARLFALAPTEGGELGVEALGEAAAPPAAAGDLRAQLAALERRLLEEALAASAGNQSEAARRLGLSRVTMLDKCKRHGLL